MSYPMDLWGIYSASLAYYALIIIAFAVIGAGLKYIDDAFDEEMFSKKIAMLTAPILVILWACLSIFDSISATILFSVLFAVLLSGKVDNFVFELSSISLVLILFLTQMSHLLLAPLFVLTVMGITDEKGNDYVDKRRIHEVWEFFFAHRCSMKVGIFGLCMVSLLPWPYMIAFLAFDTAYDFVGVLKYLEVPNFSFKVKKIQLALIILKKLK
jgi:hypothetical protein